MYLWSPETGWIQTLNLELSLTQRREEIIAASNFEADLTSLNSVDTHTHVMADPSDEIIPVALSTFESSTSSSFLSDQQQNHPRLTPRDTSSSGPQNLVRLPPSEPSSFISDPQN